MSAELTQLQACLLEMLDWLHHVCQEEGIRYYIIGGTMLGAMRHGGFIPWDDDVDVGLPRPDYEHFIQLMNARTGRYTIETPYSTQPDYCYNYSKLYDTTTTLVESGRFAIKRGVFIDVFPIDGIGDTADEARSRYRVIKRLKLFLIARRRTIHSGVSLHKRVAIFLAQALPISLAMERKLAQKLDALCAERDYDTSRYVGNLLGAYHEKEIVPRSLFGRPTPVSFESITVMGLQCPDEYLESIYGDWKTPPDEKHRHTAHSYAALSFDDSYLS